MSDPQTSSPRIAADGIRIVSDETPLLLTINEACAVLRVSRWQLYDLINKRRLKTVQINRRRLVVPSDLTRFVEQLQQEADDGQ